MPLMNQRGDVIMGGGGTQGSLNQVPYPFATYGRGVFQDDDTILVSLVSAGAAIARWHKGEAFASVIQPQRSANFGAGGGGKWLMLGEQPGSRASLLYGSLPDRLFAGAPDISFDGMIAFKTIYQSIYGLTIILPDGTELPPTTVTADGRTTLAGVAPDSLHALVGGAVIWQGGAYGRTVPRPHHANAANVQLAETSDGVAWLLYWSDGVGLVLHPDGEHAGYVLEDRAVAFNAHLIAIGADVLVASAWTAAEAPQELVKLRANRSGVQYLVDVDPNRVAPTWRAFSVPPVQPPIVPPVKPPIVPPVTPPVQPPVVSLPYPLIKGITMQTERGWLVGLGDRALSVDNAGWVHFTKTDLLDEDLLEATPVQGDARSRCTVRPVARPDLFIGADATQFTPSANVGIQYYGKAMDAPGNYEMWSFGKWPSGTVQAVVEYIEQGADNGRHWQAAGLTWVKKS